MSQNEGAIQFLVTGSQNPVRDSEIRAAGLDKAQAVLDEIALADTGGSSNLPRRQKDNGDPGVLVESLDKPVVNI